MHRVVFPLMAVWSVVPILGCSESTSTSCVTEECDDACQRAGFPSGVCNGDECQCIENADGDGDVDADADGDGDADSDADGDSDADLDGVEGCGLVYAILADLRIDGVEHPAPVIDGTRFRVSGHLFGSESTCVTREVILQGASSGPSVEVLMDVEVVDDGLLHATLPRGGVATLGGEGTFTGELIVRYVREDGGQIAAEYTMSFALVETLTPEASSISNGDVHLNDPVDVEGSGFLDGASEGDTEAVLNGVYSIEGGGATDVEDVVVPMSLGESSGRDNASFLWSPLIGGLQPGSFVGTVTLQNSRGVSTVVGSTVSLEMTQLPSELIEISPGQVSLGQFFDVAGLGFVGVDSRARTSVRFLGEFRPCRGSGSSLSCSYPPEDVDVVEVAEWVSGRLVKLPILVSNEGGVLHSVAFGAARGTFEGTVTASLTVDAESLDLAPLSGVSLTLGPVRQVLWVRFGHDFASSLELFGVGALDAVVRQRTLERLEEIFCPPDDPWGCVNVDVREAEPTDYFIGAFSIVDIGGIDPMGIGLEAYDAAPFKDVGNLRLWDHVGGDNALGALDGYGYGGVFIETMLFWSEHPPFDVTPPSAPRPDPLFDEVFDAVRDEPVVAGEYPSGADVDRLAAIEAALGALSSMIADQAAHAVGHSLGLAQPFGGPGEVHNVIPVDGCIMDAGDERPFVERARLAGNEGARFCGENLWYLQDVLPTE